jgi:tripartite-type tricarboxylate transporter receptor subunit TctC
MKRRHALLQLLALAVALPAAHAQSERWPEKPVRVIVAYAPGGATDIVARIIATRLSKELGQQFIVDNRAGGGGTIGTALAAKANPDGYTTLVMGTGYAANVALYKLPFDPVRGFAPVGIIATAPLILAMNPSVKAANLKEFIDLARARPGELNYGSAGNGSFGHLCAELFRQLTKTEMVHVPYKGDGPAIVDLMAGQVQFLFASGPALIPHFKTGRLRGLAVTTEQRAPALPDLPAISEVVPGYSVRTWFGMWTSAGTPKEIVSRLNQTLQRILTQPDMQERLRTDGLEPAPSTPAEFEREIVRDIEKWSKVVKAGNIKIN